MTTDDSDTLSMALLILLLYQRLLVTLGGTIDGAESINVKQCEGNE